MRARGEALARCATGVVGCVAVLAVTAASPPPVSTAAQATPAIVWVHATVTDAEGRVVTGLGKDEFTVLDGGVIRPISVFSSEELPVAISLMLDISGSMEKTLPNVRRAAETLLDQFIAGDRVNVGTFASEIATSARFTANRKKILDGITNAMMGGELLCRPPSKPQIEDRGLPLAKRGGTWMWDAIECGIQTLQTDGEAHRRVLVLVTDGKENGGYATGESAKRMANNVGVLVYAVGLQGIRGRADTLLQDLTLSTGGAYLPLEEKDDFGPPFRRIAEELHAQYILGFESKPGAFGSLQVTVKTPGLTVRSRRGYVVPPVKK